MLVISRLCRVLHLATLMPLLAAAVAALPLYAAAQDVGPGWTPIAAAGPAARWDHTLAADPATGRLILFGGRDVAGAPFGDTWLYDTTAQAWTPVEGPAPSPRFGQAIAVDTATRALYLFAGQADGATFFNDVWRFDLDALAWEEIATGELAPSPRYGTSAVLDGAGNLLISHGFTFAGRFDDTWSLDLETGAWTDVSPPVETRPLKRCLHEAVWDAAAHRMLLYGGCSSGFGPCPQGDLWSFDPVSRAWTELTPVAAPAARSNPALIRDDASGAIWLIDGLTETGYVADLWSLDTSGEIAIWSEVAQGESVPVPRASHDVALLAGDAWLFGGHSDAGPLADLWVLQAP
jgi:hypothetical protein